MKSRKSNKIIKIKLENPMYFEIDGKILSFNPLAMHLGELLYYNIV
jgi:hypothetical protein